MNDEELMVTIPYDRLEKLLDIETRAAILEAITIASEYRIEKEEIARILGFTLPAKNKKDEGGPF